MEELTHTQYVTIGVFVVFNKALFSTNDIFVQLSALGFKAQKSIFSEKYSLQGALFSNIEHSCNIKSVHDIITIKENVKC